MVCSFISYLYTYMAVYYQIGSIVKLKKRIITILKILFFVRCDYPNDFLIGCHSTLVCFEHYFGVSRDFTFFRKIK